MSDGKSDEIRGGEIAGAVLAEALAPDLSPDAVRRLLDAKLDFAALTEPFEAHLPDTDEPVPLGSLRDAAVLIPIVNRPEGLTVILTRRPDTLANHPGQIAFPGGRIDPTDAGPVEAALREAEEEIGLAPSLVDVRGVLAPLATGTGFKIFPVLGLVDAAFKIRPNPAEVAEAFEVPFAFLMDPENHLLKSGQFAGRTRSYYEVPYLHHRIWGATARMIVDLYRRLFA